MDKVEKGHVYFVTVIEPYQEPVHTVFNNQEASIKMYNYFVNKTQEVLVDYCPIYSEFRVE